MDSRLHLWLSVSLLFNGLGFIAGSVTVVPAPGGNLIVRDGSTATLRCVVSSTMSVTQWTKGSEVLSSSSDSRIQFSDSLKTLMISRVTKADEGQYFCYAKSNSSSVESGDAYLDIVVRPTVVATNATAQIGQQAVLTCTGQDFIDIYWEFGGLPVNDDANHQLQDKNHKLIVKSVSPADSGIYECRAVNQFFGTIVYAHLFIGELPLILSQPVNITVALRHEAELVCVVDGSPTPSVSWQHNGKNVDFSSGRYIAKQDGGNYTLVIISVQESDTGPYTCVATTRLGQTASIPAWVTVQDIDGLCVDVNVYVIKTVRRGGTVTLCCGDDGNDNSEPNWMKNAAFINVTANPRLHTVNGGALVVERAKYKDTGSYECMRDSILYTANLTVKGLPAQPIIRQLKITDQLLVFVQWFASNTSVYTSITEWIVACQRPSEQLKWVNVSVSADIQSTTVDCLQTFGTYYIFVVAINKQSKVSSRNMSLEYQRGEPTDSSTDETPTPTDKTPTPTDKTPTPTDKIRHGSSEANNGIAAGVGSAFGVLAVLVVAVIALWVRHTRNTHNFYDISQSGAATDGLFNEGYGRSDDRPDSPNASLHIEQNDGQASYSSNLPEHLYESIKSDKRQITHQVSKISQTSEYSNLGESGPYQNIRNTESLAEGGTEFVETRDECHDGEVFENYYSTGHDCYVNEHQDTGQSRAELQPETQSVLLHETATATEDLLQSNQELQFEMYPNLASENKLNAEVLPQMRPILLNESVAASKDLSSPTSPTSGVPRVKLTSKDSEQLRSKDNLVYLGEGEDVHSRDNL